MAGATGLMSTHRPGIWKMESRLWRLPWQSWLALLSLTDPSFEAEAIVVILGIHA